MSITISNLRFSPYQQKDAYKAVFGDELVFDFVLPSPHIEGDTYALGLDYEHILFPQLRPLCAYTDEWSISTVEQQSILSMTLLVSSARFRDWASRLKKPTPITLQLVRFRDGVCDTLLLDDILALPSIMDGNNTVFPGDPLEELLDGKLDKPEAEGQTGYVLGLAEDGSTVWIPQSGGGGSQQATDAEINARESTTHTITPNNLDYAARSVLANITTIPSATTAYSLLDASATTNNHSWQYFHAPEAASTYTFPAVTDTAVAHRIKLTIDFTDVQTYSFEDSQGTAIAPLFTPTIAAGDVYEFDCEYSAVKSQWLIWPHKQGAVSDDYVMQSQVGAANGVASLGSNGLVPRNQLPTADNSNKGIVVGNFSHGIRTSSTGDLYIYPASSEQIDGRTGGQAVYNYMPIVCSNLNYAVAAALTDANKIQLTDAQKASAQDTLGVGAAPIIGTTAPTTSTAGSVGQLYVDTTTSKTYHCTAATNTGTEQEPVWSYTWVDDVNAKGGTFTRAISVDNIITCNGITSSMGSGGNIRFNGTWPANDFGSAANANISVCNKGRVDASSYLVGTSLFGKYNVIPTSDMQGAVGGGTSDAERHNIEELSWSGNHYIAGGHQQGVTAIPSATTAYTLAEGCQSHTPSSASTYTLQAVPMRIIADGRYFTRNPSTDGTGYYGWLSGTTNRYTASATPAVGDNTYTNTALTQDAKAITAIDERTHECILTVRFSSSVLTYAFEDAAGNTLTPLPLAGTIADGSVVAFRCTWEALLGQWVIEPKLLNPNA